MARSHMADSGLSPEERAAIVAGSRAAERFVATTYRGILMEPGHPDGDVFVPGHGLVDVKSVPNVRATFVDAGDKRPVVDCVVVAREELLVIGLVAPTLWELGRPPIPRGRICWHVRRANVMPPPGNWARIGCVLPEWYQGDDALHDDWNDRDRRRNERRDLGRPLVLPGVGDETSPSYIKGTGLARTKGHAPGKDNAIRKRPRRAS